MNIEDRLLAEMPKELFKFLDTLTGNELNELNKIDPRLIAKVYQAGAKFSLNVALKLKDDK
jgi:hypothetical protein